MLELGRRDFTNVLVEGGAELLGACLDQRLMDEVHVFIAPKLVGSSDAPAPIGGQGIAEMQDAFNLTNLSVETLDGDIHISGFVSREESGDV